MSRCVAFLRGINVGGHTVPMADLRRHFEAAGCSSVETVVASGNVVFERVSDSKVYGGGLEKALGQPATLRNIRTVRRIAETCA